MALPDAQPARFSTSWTADVTSMLRTERSASETLSLTSVSAVVTLRAETFWLPPPAPKVAALSAASM